jgi:hypothetical protein
MDDSICLDKSPRGVNKLEHVPEKLQRFSDEIVPKPTEAKNPCLGKRCRSRLSGAAPGFPVPVPLAKRGLLGQ